MSTRDDDHRPSAAHGTWTESKRDGWTYNRDPDPREANPQSWCDDPRFNRSMAAETARRGYLNLSQAHALAAKDCPRGCACRGCESTKAEAQEARAAKAKRASRPRRDAA